jgi:hypothetical protein
VSSPSNIRHADIVTCEFVKPAFPQTLPWQDQSRTTYQVPAELLEVALDKKKKKKKKKKKNSIFKKGMQKFNGYYFIIYFCKSNRSVYIGLAEAEETTQNEEVGFLHFFLLL